MRVLVTHEESGVVRRAFRALGHDAWSNDLLPSRDDSPHHLKMDAVDAIAMYGPWDIIISHIECTEMAVSGNRWYGQGKPGHGRRLHALDLAEEFWALAKANSRVGCAVENPVSVLWARLGQPQYIQPWQFGHRETKNTGILTDRLPPLVPTNIVGPPPATARSATRKRDRSETKQGIAEAMAEQWGDL